jgi:ankyrin repeat protein
MDTTESEQTSSTPNLQNEPCTNTLARLPNELWASIITFASDSVADFFRLSCLSSSIRYLTLNSASHTFQLLHRLYEAPVHFLDALLAYSHVLPNVGAVTQLAITKGIINQETVPNAIRFVGIRSADVLKALITHGKYKVTLDHFGDTKVYSFTPALKVLLEGTDSTDWHSIPASFILTTEPSCTDEYRDGDKVFDLMTVISSHFLYIACRFTDAEFVETKLIEGKGFGYERHRRAIYQNALFFACMSSNLDMFDLLVRHRNQWLETRNAYDEKEGLEDQEWTCAMSQCPLFASYMGTLPMLKHLEATYQLDITTPHPLWNNETPLHAAISFCSKMNDATVDYLLTRYKELNPEALNSQTIFGDTPLHYAAGKPWIIHRLLEAGADPNLHDEDEHFTPIERFFGQMAAGAIPNEYVDFVREIVQPYLEAPNHHTHLLPDSPIFSLMIQFITHFFIEKGWVPDEQNIAVENRLLESVEGPYMNSTCYVFGTVDARAAYIFYKAFTKATTSSDSSNANTAPFIFKPEDQFSAEIYTGAESGHLHETLLHYLCREQNIDSLKFCLFTPDFFTNFNCRDSAGRTPLHVAVSATFTVRKVAREIVALFTDERLNGKVDWNAVDKEGRSVLDVARVGRSIVKGRGGQFRKYKLIKAKSKGKEEDRPPPLKEKDTPD